MEDNTQVSHFEDKSLSLLPNYGFVESYYDKMWNYLDDKITKAREGWLSEFRKNKPNELAIQGNHYSKSSQQTEF